MITALALLALTQTYTIHPATEYMSAKEIDDFVVDVRTQHASESVCDPLWLVRTVNKLQPMGQDKGLALLKEIAYRRVNVGDKVGDDIYWLVNLLYEVPDLGVLPSPMIGAITPEQPADKKLLPRWPLVLNADVPLSTVMGVMLGGQAEAPDAYAIRLAGLAKWRVRPLRPTDNPFDAVRSVQSSAGYKALMSKTTMGDMESMLAGQAARLVRNAYTPHSMPRNRISGTEAMDIYRNQYSSLHARWNKELQLYTRGDGTYDKRW